MYKSLVAPGKYYQGKDIIKNLYEHVKFAGERFVIVTDSIVLSIIRESIERGFKGSTGRYQYAIFNNESTLAEAERISSIVKLKKSEGVIGIGGGKVIDTSKLVADLCNLPLVIIPTAASSDAPCSGLSVIYEEDGTFLKSIRMKKNPDLVLVDTTIIANSPVRLLVAGMGDAFATYYEARACKRSCSVNFTGGIQTEAAYGLAKICNDVLLKYGQEAKKSVEEKRWSEELEKIVEANVFLSGVGFENNGCAIAHAIYNGMTAVLKPFPVMHGEGVAFGTIVQLVTEYLVENNWDENEWAEVIGFYKKVGLPLSFRDLGVIKLDEDIMWRIAEATCNSGPNAHKMPFKVTPEVIYQSLIRVNKIF
ncbi:MAG: glycerol dehydrogenase [Dethiosulfatibacter sp.]|nr:glycerol dehydrogenase [Dethiosulfatibacter sp.]